MSGNLPVLLLILTFPIEIDDSRVCNPLVISSPGFLDGPVFIHVTDVVLSPMLFSLVVYFLVLFAIRA